MLGIKELSLRGLELSENYAFALKNEVYKLTPSRIRSVKTRLDNMLEKLKKVGKGSSITRIVYESYEPSKNRDKKTVYYLTHDDDELDYLIRRDIGEDAVKYAERIKISSGDIITGK